MKRYTTYILLGVALVASLLFSGYQMEEKNKYRRYLDYDYRHSFHQASGYIENVNNLLKKVEISELPEQTTGTLAEIWKQAAAAHDSISRLPYNHEMIASSLKFLSQVSDLSYSLMKKSMEYQELSEEDWKKLKSMRVYSESLSSRVNEVIAQSGTLKLDWDKLITEEPSTETVVDNEVLGSMVEVHKQFMEYPTLIYDGPFSDHIRDMKPLFTEGMKEITIEEGKAIAIDVLKNFSVSEVRYAGTSDEAAQKGVPVFSYEVFTSDTNNASIWIDITKKGGYPLLILNGDPVIGEHSFSTDQAIEMAKGFLQRNGFANMEYSYYDLYENSIVINFAPMENNILLYSDLAKVKISLVDGRLLGFEALGYIMMHHERQSVVPTISEEVAKGYVSHNFKIDAAQLCVIPLEDMSEALCYEFTGTHEDLIYKIYINAHTAKLEKVYEIIMSESGVLAQ